MTIVDSLLNLIAVQRAEGLLIASDEVPRLIYGEEERALSMPPISAGTVEDFAREVRASSQIQTEAKQNARSAGSAASEVGALRYSTEAGEEFDVSIEGAGATLRLLFRPVALQQKAQDPVGSSVAPLGRSSDDAATSVEAAGFDSPSRLLEWLSRLERERGSDLILSSGASARMRTGGLLRELPGPALDDEDILALFGPALDSAARERLDACGSIDLALELDVAGMPSRFRVNIFKQQRGMAAALRPIRRDLPSLQDLNLPDHLYELALHRNGLVLITGPTGSGKSTTLAALLEYLNRSADRHVITLEDPIEFLYEPKRCLIHQREVGRHIESFASGLRAALREDPDVILVGEMRDRDTISAALTAAETGHLVLSTLHSATPWTSIDRMIDVFPPDQQRQVRLQLSDVLRAIVSQQLLPSTAPPLRVPAFEKLLVTDGVASQIREDKLHQIQTSIQTGRDSGMMSIERCLAELLSARRIDPDVARAAAHDPRLLADLCRG